MNFVISIINNQDTQKLLDIHSELGLKVSLLFKGRGTASRKMLDMLDIESNERGVAFAIAGEEMTQKLIKKQKQYLAIDAPNRGIIVAVPIKSVGGRKTLEYVSEKNEEVKFVPELNVNFELIIVIANNDHIETVMDAARGAGAAGGTVLHGKGTGAKAAEKFFNVSLANEKEVILIVAKKETKSQIMQAIIRNAGPSTDAGAICFSLPVSEAAGFSLMHD